MKKALLTLAVLYAIAALGTPYFIASETEKDTKAFFASPNQQTLAQQGIELTLNHYHKGYFHSSANIHVKIQDRFSATTYYENNIDVDITHAPLSLSGLNAISISATGAAQPGGEFGRYVPADFITFTAQQSLIDLILGRRGIANATTLKALNTQIGDSKIHFQGASLTAKPDNTANLGELQFNGIDIGQTDSTITIQPFNLTLNIAIQTPYDFSAAITIDQLNIDGRNDKQSIHFTLHDFNQTVNMLAAQANNFAHAAVAAISFSADTLTLDVNAKQNGGITLNNTDFQLGFIPDGDNYATNFTLQTQPTYSGVVKQKLPLQPNNIDIGLTIASFPRSTTFTTLRDLQSQYLSVADTLTPVQTSNVLTQILFALINDNVMHQDLSIDLNAQISDAAGDLVNLKGNIHEYLKQSDELMALMLTPTQSIPTYFHNSTLSVFLSRAFLDQTGIEQTWQDDDIPTDAYLTDAGDLKLDVSVTDKQILLNGEPAPR